MEDFNSLFFLQLCQKYNFDFNNFIGYKALSKGHINTTYTLYFDNKNHVKRYLLQEINTNVFKNPTKLMENINKISEHYKKKLKKVKNYKNKVLRVVKTKDNRHVFITENNRIYRIYHYIENAVNYDISDNKKIFYESGKIIGEFSNYLSDFPIDTLYESIPDFHNCIKRYSQFENAYDNSDKNIKNTCEDEIMFFKNNKYLPFSMQEKINNNEFKQRVTHNDTKLNNLMFQHGTNKGLCVVDLDTVMKGCLCYDFGDFIRSACNLKGEDEKDIHSIIFQKELCLKFAEGFIEKMDDITEIEVKHLIDGSLTMIYECGMRFLTDYLSGNTYFKIHYPTHNLTRCKTQIEMYKQLLLLKEELDDKIYQIYQKKITKI